MGIITNATVINATTGGRRATNRRLNRSFRAKSCQHSAKFEILWFPGLATKPVILCEVCETWRYRYG